MITLVVEGVPAPKGSGRAMMIAGRARFIASSSRANEKAQIAWSLAVREAARAQPVRLSNKPLAITIAFRLPRIKAHYRTGRHAGQLRPDAPTAHTVNPDVDKLARCTLDALVSTVSRGTSYVGIIDDDNRVVSLSATKRYAERPGATITIEEWGPT
jgi:crossover junction endodeoxyribonuclease RusA